METTEPTGFRQNFKLKILPILFIYSNILSTNIYMFYGYETRMIFAHKQKHKRRSQFHELLHQSFTAHFPLNLVLTTHRLANLCCHSDASLGMKLARRKLDQQ